MLVRSLLRNAGRLSIFRDLHLGNPPKFKKLDTLRVTTLDVVRCANYYSPIAPAKWAEHFPAAKGLRQSPIDLAISKSTYDAALAKAKWTFDYHPNDCNLIKNNGNTWMVSVKEEAGSKMTTSVFPNTSFRFLQMHAHWGEDALDGTEHTVNGDGYAMEVHMVHWNEKYGSPGEAANHGDGFCVLGIFVKEGKENAAFQPLIKAMDFIKFKHQTAPLDGFDLKTLFPKDIQHFWSYEGSLTTPPCTECVQWIVFKDPIAVSNDQLEEIRQLNVVEESESAHKVEKLIHNVRPVQDLGNRVLRSSF